jgi:hypothetical protein
MNKLTKLKIKLERLQEQFLTAKDEATKEVLYKRIAFVSKQIKELEDRFKRLL